MEKKKNKKNTIPEALITTTTKKQIIKEEPIQRMENSVSDQKQNLPKPDRVDSEPDTNVLPWNPIATTAGRREILQGCADRELTTEKLKKITDEQLEEPNESPSESDESIHHIEEIKNVEE